jgi:hypothetical protein
MGHATKDVKKKPSTFVQQFLHRDKVGCRPAKKKEEDLFKRK